MTQTWNQKRYAITGFLTLGFLVFGMGGWSAFSHIRGAVVGNGMVEVATKRQVVQHPNGGVVGSINVDDGDTVKAGDLLLRLDDSLDRSELNVIESQLFSLLGMKARIEAEQTESADITFDSELLERAKTDTEAARIVKSQQQLLFARRDTRDKQIGQMNERKTQTQNQIEGLEARYAALKKQLDFVTVQVEDQKSLLEKGLTQKSQLLVVQRNQAEIEGSLSEVQSSIAQNKASIAEMELAILNISSKMREESITAMPDTEAKIAELQEKRNSRLEVLSRMDVRAPVSGVIFGLQVHSVRSVIRPAEPILYIIPQDVDLVITSQISPKDIDQVHVGQDVSIHFTNFDRRQTPQLQGKVLVVSADVTKDERTGAAFYTAQVRPNPGEIDKLGSNVVIPGMQVETYIETAERTPLEYLVKPLADYFTKAFRER
jgi:HlyD family secretion protein